MWNVFPEMAWCLTELDVDTAAWTETWHESFIVLFLYLSCLTSVDTVTQSPIVPLMFVWIMLRSFSGGCFLSIVKPIIIIIIIIIMVMVMVMVIVIVTITIVIIIVIVIIIIIIIITKAMHGLAKNSALDHLGMKIAREMLVELCRALAHLN